MNRNWQSRRTAMEAAAWVARLDSAETSDEDRAAHQRWLDASALNREEYAAAQRIVFLATQLEDPALLEAAAGPATAERSTRHRRTFAGLAAAAAAALCIVFVWNHAFLGQPEAQLFTTAVGERREVELADGSVVTLNTDSRMRVPGWSGTRAVVLERGEAFFAVAHDAERPFIAQAGGGSARVLGTKFNVRLDDARATLAVVEGRVELSLSAPAEQRRGRQVLGAGEGAIYGIDGTWLQAQQIQADRITAWRTGRFVFSGTTLEEVVREVNRYSHSKVLIADAGLESLRVSGTFPIDRIPDLLQMLEKALPVHVVTRGDTILLIAR